jgi:hypothetical protein
MAVFVFGTVSGRVLYLSQIYFNFQASKMTNSSTKESKTGLQALVFGASGITGWAITNSALTYPTSSTFSRVVGLTSRPLSLETSGFPTDSRLQLYSDLDLSQDAETITKYLRKIEKVERITHVYFAGM